MLSEGRIRFYRKNTPADLICLGLAFGYGDYTQATGWYRVTEPIAVIALQEYFIGSDFKALSNTFAHLVNGMATLLDRHGLSASRGTLFEDMVIAAFQQERFQGQLVADLPFVRVPLEEMQAYSTNLRQTSRLSAPVAAADPWWTKTTFQARSVVREDAQQEQLGLNVADLLSARPHISVSPETTVRFDGMVMLGPKEAVTWAITIWAGEVPSEKVKNQILSTDPALAYYLMGGKEVNPKCLERRLWEARGLNLVRAVRVHVALPESMPRRCATIEGDCLLVRGNEQHSLAVWQRAARAVRHFGCSHPDETRRLGCPRTTKIVVVQLLKELTIKPTQHRFRLHTSSKSCSEGAWPLCTCMPRLCTDIARQLWRLI